MARLHSPDVSQSTREPGTAGNGPDFVSGRAYEGNHRSVPALIGDLMRELRDLARNETQLARTEMSERLQKLQSGAGSLGAAAVIALPGVFLLLQSAMLGLDLWIEEPWLSALIVGGVAVLIGTALALAGRKRLKPQNLAPRRTAESLQRDAEVIRREREHRTAPIGGVHREEVR